MPLSVKYFIDRNTRNLFIGFVILLLLVVILSVPAFPAFGNLFFSPFQLDYQRAFVPENLESVTGSGSAAPAETQKADTGAVSNRSDLERLNKSAVNVQAQDAYDYTHPYKQGIKYKFGIKPIAAYETGLYYEATFTVQVGIIEAQPPKPVLSHKYIMLDVGDALILARVAPDFKIKPGQTYRGLFLKLQGTTFADLCGVLNRNVQLKNVFAYELDTLADFTGNELTDFLLYAIPCALTVLLGLLLVVYKTNFRRHPTFSRLANMYPDPDGVMASIDADLSDDKNVIKRKNIYTTENWIINRGFFKTKFAMIKKKARFDN